MIIVFRFEGSRLLGSLCTKFSHWEWLGMVDPLCIAVFQVFQIVVLETYLQVSNVLRIKMTLIIQNISTYILLDDPWFVEERKLSWWESPIEKPGNS